MDEIKVNKPAKNIQPVSKVQINETINDSHNKNIATFVGIIILIVLILVGGFYALKTLKQADNKIEVPKVIETTPAPTVPVVTPPAQPEVKTPSEDTVVKPAVKDPDKVVEEFYNWYTNYSGDPIADGAYKTQEAVSEDLITKIESSSKDINPFLCSKDKSSGFKVEPASISGDGSSVTVNVTKDSTIIPVKVNLKLNGSWKMTNITCLSGDGETSLLENLKLVTSLDYTTVEDRQFLWNVPDYKGRKAMSVAGKGISTANASLDPNVIKNFFIKNGFKSDNYNSSGFKKGDIVCLDSSKLQEANKLDVKIECGKLNI